MHKNSDRNYLASYCQREPRTGLQRFERRVLGSRRLGFEPLLELGFKFLGFRVLEEEVYIFDPPRKYDTCTNPPSSRYQPYKPSVLPLKGKYPKP